MTDSNVDGLEQLLNLEEKIGQTIDLLKSTRAENEELERENTRLRRECGQQSEAIDKLADRLGRLERERDTVRARLQKLLEQVDSLTSERAEA